MSINNSNVVKHVDSSGRLCFSGVRRHVKSNLLDNTVGSWNRFQQVQLLYIGIWLNFLGLQSVLLKVMRMRLRCCAYWIIHWLTRHLLPHYPLQISWDSLSEWFNFFSLPWYGNLFIVWLFWKQPETNIHNSTCCVASPITSKTASAYLHVLILFFAINKRCHYYCGCWRRSYLKTSSSWLALQNQ